MATLAGLGSLLSGGSAMLGAFGGGDAPSRGESRAMLEMQYGEQRDNDKKKFSALRKGALAGGFNPLTALQSGGLSQGSFAASGGGGGAPLASLAAALGGAATVADELTGVNAQARARSQLETDILKLQYEQLAALPASARSTVAGPAILGPQARGDGAPLAVHDPLREQVMLGGQKVATDTNYSDAGAVTQRYGEPAEWLYAPVVVGADIGNSVRKFFGRTEQASDTWRKVRTFNGGEGGVVRRPRRSFNPSNIAVK